LRKESLPMTRLKKDGLGSDMMNLLEVNSSMVLIPGRYENLRLPRALRSLCSFPSRPSVTIDCLDTMRFVC
jgi:hypothetical protein